MTSFPSYDGTVLSFVSEGTGPVLVCLAGGPGHSAAYFEDLAGLTSSRTVLLFDPRGVGRSDLPADPATLRFDRLAWDLEALREHLGQQTLHVLGHSAGAITAQAWAAQFPLSVGSLLLLTPSDHLQGGDRADLPGLRETYSAEPWYTEAMEAYAELADAPPSQQTQLRRALLPFQYARWDERAKQHAARSEATISKRAQAGYIAGFDQVDVARMVAGLAAVTAPVLVVGGTRDAVSGCTSVDLVASCFPNATVGWVDGAGHHPWIDEPAAFRAAVDPFLS
jgi:proline iminopeptidase